MGRGCPVVYDDEWIVSNWRNFRNWRKLCARYNEVHCASIGYNTFKSHCNRELDLNYHYSVEQIEWLVENYPKLGRVKATEEFNRTFGENRSVMAIKVKCRILGLTVTEERKKMVSIENTNRYYDVGSVVKKSHGEPYVKTERGWIRLKELVYGERPDGYIIVHLDGDVENCDKENLIAIPRTISATMTKNKFWSEDGNITKTGILCCTLEKMLL